MVRERKFHYIIFLGILYFVSFWLLTVGYFTPNWAMSATTSCGLVTGSCRFPYTQYNLPMSVGKIGHAMHVAMFLTTTSIVVVYSNALMLGIAVFFSLFENQIFMLFLAISFGVLYPIASILVLLATIYVEATNESGYSVILCNIAGGMMLLFYIGLIVNDNRYTKKRRRDKENSAGLSNRSGTTSARMRDAQRLFRYPNVPPQMEVKTRYGRGNLNNRKINTRLTCSMSR